MPLIYRIDCTTTGLTYVGQTVLSLEDRWRAHVDYASWVIRHRPEKDTHFARAIRKYGVAAFVPIVIEEVPEQLLNEAEIRWIAELGTFENGYNSTKGGEGLRGFIFSEESRDKMRQKATGRKHTAETLEKIGTSKRGVKQTSEHVAKRVARNAGQTRTPEQRARIAAGNLGLKRSDETRARIAEAGRGRVTSEETKKKLGKRVNHLTRDGQLIASYDTLTSAAAATGYSKGAVCNNIRDPERWPLKDAKFEYTTT